MDAHTDEDHIYKEEMLEMARNGVLHEVHTAYSHLPGQPKELGVLGWVVLEGWRRQHLKFDFLSSQVASFPLSRHISFPSLWVLLKKSFTTTWPCCIAWE